MSKKTRHQVKVKTLLQVHPEPPARHALKEQWGYVDAWRERLAELATLPVAPPSKLDPIRGIDEDLLDDCSAGESIRCASPGLSRLVAQFRAAEAAQGGDFPLRPQVDSDPEYRRQPLFDLVIQHLRLGYLPPLEWLIALTEMHLDYLGAGGKLDLEDAFYGPPVRRTGNRARRVAAASSGARRAARWASERERTDTNIEAAVEAIKAEGLDIDPESYLRSIQPYIKKPKPD